MEYLMRYECSQQYGGPEEGGWWYDLMVPQWKLGIPLPLPQKLVNKICRWLNGKEHDRRNRENRYEYTSVLSYEDEYYSFNTEESLRPQQPTKPHYE